MRFYENKSKNYESKNHVISTELLRHDYSYRKLFLEHAQVDDEIERLEAFPSNDDQRVKRLKKLKLYLLDRMGQIARRTRGFEAA